MNHAAGLPGIAGRAPNRFIVTDGEYQWAGDAFGDVR
jgi:hypothetical protein